MRLSTENQVLVEEALGFAAQPSLDDLDRLLDAARKQGVAKGKRAAALSFCDCEPEDDDDA